MTTMNLIWHKNIPLKVNMFVRGVITATSQSCMRGCGNLEDKQCLCCQKDQTKAMREYQISSTMQNQLFLDLKYKT